MNIRAKRRWWRAPAWYWRQYRLERADAICWRKANKAVPIDQYDYELSGGYGRSQEAIMFLYLGLLKDVLDADMAREDKVKLFNKAQARHMLKQVNEKVLYHVTKKMRSK